jgi:hypothetical protein
LQRSWKTLLRRDWREVEILAEQNYEMGLRLTIAQAACTEDGQSAAQAIPVLLNWEFSRYSGVALIGVSIFCIVVYYLEAILQRIITIVFVCRRYAVICFIILQKKADLARNLCVDHPPKSTLSHHLYDQPQTVHQPIFS